MRSSLLLTVVAAPSLALAVWACGGKEASVDREGASTNAQTAGQGDPANGGQGQTSTGTATPSQTTAPAPDCKHSNESGSGGGGGDGTYSCTVTHDYACTNGERSITCDCSGKNGAWEPGTCTCSDTGVTFAYDCKTACTLPSETYAKCNLPAPPPPPPGSGEGSTSSSSGGP